MLRRLRLYSLVLKKREILCTVLLVTLLIYAVTLVQLPVKSVREYYISLSSDLHPCMIEINCKRFYQACPIKDQKKFIREAFLHAWKNYHSFAWGHDHLKPDTKGYDDNLLGLGATLIDSLTSLHLLGFREELAISRLWLMQEFDMKKKVGKISFFEVSIRLMGSLVSTYHLTGDRVYLDKAMEIGNIAMECFKDSDLPDMGLDLSAGTCNSDPDQECLYQDCSDSEPCKFYYCKAQISEVGTLGLEFRALTAASGDTKFGKAVNKTSNKLINYQTWDGLASRYLYKEEGRFVESSDIGTGPGLDSYYEYLLKQWIHSNYTATRFKSKYLQAVEGIRDHLIMKVKVRGEKVKVLGQRADNITLTPELHHLSCFLPGTLALGHFHGLPRWHLELAEELIQRCYYLYATQPTGLAADLIRFTSEGLEALSTENHLRPETLESLYLLWKVTRNQKYRDMAWSIFQGFERGSRVCNGYSSVYDVRNARTVTLDIMESFYLAETLKYLYLIFSEDDLLPLDKWVFNTEAHPLPILNYSREWY